MAWGLDWKDFKTLPVSKKGNDEGMDFRLSDEQEYIKRAARVLAEEEFQKVALGSNWKEPSAGGQDGIT